MASVRLHASILEEPEVNFLELTKLQSNPVKVEKEVAIDQNINSRNRIEIIERLEQRYTAGGIRKISRDTANSCINSDDDYYDSEDSFIDDEDLHETIEAECAGKKMKTKYSGFFVNAGQQIETICPSADEEEDDFSEKSKQKGKYQGRAKQFVDDWAVAASEWKTSPEIELAIKELETEASEYFQDKEKVHGKVFPKALEQSLSKVDRLVVASHPNKWRLNAYYARLMQFLPFFKGTLKVTMLRLEAKYSAEEAHKKFQEEDVKFSNLVQSASKNLKGAFPWPRLCKIGLYHLVEALENWVEYENQSRGFLKTADKLCMAEEDYKMLNIKQEKTKLYKKIFSYFPDGSVEIKDFRNKYKLEADKKKKLKESKDLSIKTEPNDKLKVSNNSKGGVNRTGNNISSSSSSLLGTTNRKVTPNKSRDFDEVPLYDSDDFVPVPIKKQ